MKSSIFRIKLLCFVGFESFILIQNPKPKSLTID